MSPSSSLHERAARHDGPVRVLSLDVDGIRAAEREDLGAPSTWVHTGRVAPFVVDDG